MSIQGARVFTLLIPSASHAERARETALRSIVHLMPESHVERASTFLGLERDGPLPRPLISATAPLRHCLALLNGYLYQLSTDPVGTVPSEYFRILDKMINAGVIEFLFRFIVDYFDFDATSFLTTDNVSSDSSWRARNLRCDCPCHFSSAFRIPV